MQTYTKATIGILAMVASMAWFSGMNVGIRFLAEEWHTTQIVLVRNVMSIGLLTPLVLYHGVQVLKTKRPTLHFWRSTVGVAGMHIWFYCIAIMPLNQATALSLTAPLFAAFFAIIFLGERAGLHRWGAILLGFVGAGVIMQPGSEVFDPSSLIVLLATSLWAWAGILIKRLSQTESPLSMLFYMAVIMSLWSIPIAWPHWQTPSWESLAVCLWIAFSSTGAHYCLVKAYANTDIVVLTPFDFTRLIFTAIFAYMFFAEVPTIEAFIGAAIIVISAAYIAYREKQKAKLQRMIEPVSID